MHVVRSTVLRMRKSAGEVEKQANGTPENLLNFA